MINAIELRTGNWVFVHDNTPHQLTYVINPIEGSIPLSVRLNPIPLTEELLLKIGFEKTGEGFYNNLQFFSKYDIQLSYDNNGYCIRMGNNEYFNSHNPCKSVHHLQNCYWDMTGDELLITEEGLK